jgi:hypothetical protein
MTPGGRLRRNVDCAGGADAASPIAGGTVERNRFGLHK